MTIASILPAILALMLVSLRAAGNPVTLMCSAMDKDGRYVSGLSAADLKLDEEGKRQTVAAVAAASGYPRECSSFWM
jgi:hypothetical protein